MKDKAKSLLVEEGPSGQFLKPVRDSIFIRSIANRNRAPEMICCRSQRLSSTNAPQALTDRARGQRRVFCSVTSSSAFRNIGLVEEEGATAAKFLDKCTICFLFLCVSENCCTRC